MRTAALWGIMLMLVLSLNGCSATEELENQAYALVLGMDRGGEGGIELTVRIPRIGQSEAAEAAGADPKYASLSADGSDYYQAMECLQWTAARELNLSKLKLIVVSEELASDSTFPELITEVAETRHLYTSAGFVVCQGRARAFVEDQQAALGSHLATDIEAMLRHLTLHGYIPRATFADLYYATCSCYSDPVAIWGFIDDQDELSNETPAAATIGDNTKQVTDETKPNTSRQYLGTALFRKGRMAERLNAEETLCLSLLTGKVGAFGFQSYGKTTMLSTRRGPTQHVRIDDDTVSIDVTIHLDCEDDVEQSHLDRMGAELARVVEALIHRCQALRIEPFGFAARAAAHFPTISAWRRYNWYDHFSQASVTVHVNI